MDVLGWLWWGLSGIITGLLSLVWFLISGWVSTLLQIGLLVAVVYFLKYGWQRAPSEIWRRSRSFCELDSGTRSGRERRGAGDSRAGGEGEGIWGHQHLDIVVAAGAHGGPLS
jgi:hypothetical protein